MSPGQGIIPKAVSVWVQIRQNSSPALQCAVHRALQRIVQCAVLRALQCVVQCAVHRALQCVVQCAVHRSLQCVVQCALQCAVQCAVHLAVHCIVQYALHYALQCTIYYNEFMPCWPSMLGPNYSWSCICSSVATCHTLDVTNRSITM